jgi:hypothetical protein
VALAIDVKPTSGGGRVSDEGRGKRSRAVSIEESTGLVGAADVEGSDVDGEGDRGVVTE